MKRAQVLNPETGKIVNLFSKEIESLIDLGYTIEDILKLSILPTSSHIPLTGDKDLDMIIMSHLEIKDLKNFCQFNKYTEELCTNNHFWITRFEKENLTIPTIYNDNWIKKYEIINKIEGILHESELKKMNDGIRVPFKNKSIHIFDSFTKLKDIVNPRYDKKILSIRMYKTRNNTIPLEIAIKEKDGINRTGKIDLSIEEFKNIFYILYSDNII